MRDLPEHRQQVRRFARERSSGHADDPCLHFQRRLERADDQARRVSHVEGALLDEADAGPDPDRLDESVGGSDLDLNRDRETLLPERRLQPASHRAVLAVGDEGLGQEVAGPDGFERSEAMTEGRDAHDPLTPEILDPQLRHRRDGVHDAEIRLSGQHGVDDRLIGENQELDLDPGLRLSEPVRRRHQEMHDLGRDGRHAHGSRLAPEGRRHALDGVQRPEQLLDLGTELLGFGGREDAVSVLRQQGQP